MWAKRTPSNRKTTLETPLQRLERRILRKTGKAIGDFGMIAQGDRVLVALSGGKDSWALLHVLSELKKRSPVKFTLTAVTVHPGYEDFVTGPVEEYCKAAGFKHFVEPSQMYDIIEEVREPGSSYCAICARLRRGILYGVAIREGFTKIALGHHADDLIETLLMAQFFTGEIKSMPPVLKADDGVNVVIRPLCYCWEDDIAELVALREMPVVSCGCVMAACTHSQRHRMKALLKKMEAEHPGVKSNLLSSLGRVRPEYLFPAK